MVQFVKKFFKFLNLEKIKNIQCLPAIEQNYLRKNLDNYYVGSSTGNDDELVILFPSEEKLPENFNKSDFKKDIIDTIEEGLKSSIEKAKCGNWWTPISGETPGYGLSPKDYYVILVNSESNGKDYPYYRETVKEESTKLFGEYLGIRGGKAVLAVAFPKEIKDLRALYYYIQHLAEHALIELNGIVDPRVAHEDSHSHPIFPYCSFIPVKVERFETNGYRIHDFSGTRACCLIFH